MSGHELDGHLEECKIDGLAGEFAALIADAIEPGQSSTIGTQVKKCSPGIQSAAILHIGTIVLMTKAYRMCTAAWPESEKP